MASLRKRLQNLFSTNVIVRKYGKEKLRVVDTNRLQSVGNISTTNTNEDDHLLELEKEAYLEGNITFRNWEDSVKN